MFLRDERGMVATVISLMMVPLAALVMLMVFDLARIHLVRGQLRTAADAGALAGAMTAVVEPRYVYKAVYDSNGNLALQAKIDGYDAVIKNPALAETAAREAVRRNISGALKAQKDINLLGFNVFPVSANDDFTGQVEGDTQNKYRVSLKAKLKLLLAGPLAKLYGVNDADKRIGATGTGEAIVSP